jgi:hypothetical protein
MANALRAEVLSYPMVVLPDRDLHLFPVQAGRLKFQEAAAVRTAGRRVSITTVHGGLITAIHNLQHSIAGAILNTIDLPATGAIATITTAAVRMSARQLQPEATVRMKVAPREVILPAAHHPAATAEPEAGINSSF